MGLHVPKKILAYVLSLSLAGALTSSYVQRTADAKAKVSVSGNTSLKVGANTVKVVVTAESGATKTYTITCNRAAGDASQTTENTETVTTEETTEEPDTQSIIMLNGKEYRFVQNTEGLTIPEGFVQSTGVYQNQEVLSFTSENGNMVIVCLLDESDNTVWYILEEATGGLMPYLEFSSVSTRFVVVKPADDVVIPEGYISVDYDLNGVVIPAYVQGMEETGIILVYAARLDGETGFYLFDVQENSFVRYIASESGLTEEITETTEAVVEEKTTESEEETFLGIFKLKNLKYVAAVSLGLNLLLLIVILVLCITKRKTGKLEDEEHINSTNQE